MSKNGRPVVVVSSINGDIVLQTPRYPAPGETVLASRSGPHLGGKGANVAVAVARSGLARSRLAGAVGWDGGGLLEALRGHGVDTSLVREMKDAQTGAAYVIVDAEGGNSIVVVAGANAEYRMGAGLGEAMRGAVVGVHLEMDGGTVRAVAREAKRVGATVVVNASPAAGRGGAFAEGDEAWGWVDVAVANEGELRMLAGGEGDVGERARRVGGWCAEGARVVVTVGEDGVVFVDGEGVVRRVKASKVERVVDTTGAGDTLMGYLAAGIAAGWEFERAVRVAVVAAGICVQREGAAAAIPDGEEVRKAMAEAEAEMAAEAPAEAAGR